MSETQTIDNQQPSAGLDSLDGLFEAAKKTTVIQLRWPLVILCSYLLLYSPGSWLTLNQIQFVVVFYLLTNATLYFVGNKFFDAPHFYGPLLLFDAVFLAVALGLSGGATPDFYIACFFTLVLSCICNDLRGLLIVTLLAPLIYAYSVFNSAAANDPSVYLRVLFPLVISLFYGYFAQVERIKRLARENEEQAKRERGSAEEIRRQRERLEALHAVNVAVSSTIIDRTKVLDAFLEKVSTYFSFGAAIVRLRNRETGSFATAAAKGIQSSALEGSASPIAWADRAAKRQTPLVIHNVFEECGAENLQWWRDQGLASFLSIPLVANGERLGSLAFLMREVPDFTAEEIECLSTMAGQVALAMRHAELFERIQQQANDLRLVNQVKDEFLGIVSHELKTPLNVISGYINILVEGILGELSPIQGKALQTIMRQTKELNGLINRVLQVCALETETPRADSHKINFWEFLYELKSMYEDAPSNDVRLNWEFSSDLPTLYSDRGKLKHIVENLINNALKFTDVGSVTVSARYLPDDKMMEFKIADTGIGIAKEQLPTIFDRFHQVDSSGTRAYGGMGLGLYIVKKYTELLGATIHVESKLGQGSTFVLQVPCRPDMPAAPRPEEPFALPVQAAGDGPLSAAFPIPD
ncbi:MAG: GAF domain-containing sensor histidine kinase [Deltaproteobacteria bacterium]|nr:GAF domain-containing sensor histidine kinase [Deltaproteobacteria bacterium]MBI2231222.1 GAF domain-containing sensor histidine kinase [Deltaproteobacteria bacterium]